jgi:uncharacterized ubiquitin-like protein YukD
MFLKGAVMNNPFEILIYLDENLIRNLSSITLTGFIETITKTQAFDRTLSTGVHEGDRLDSLKENRINRSEREGYKEKNKLEANNSNLNHHMDKDIDLRQCIKEEEQVKTTYTTFMLNQRLIEQLDTNKQLLHKNQKDIENNNILSGDIIEIEGIITNQGIIPYIDALINLITIFGCEYLDGLFKDCNEKFNFSISLKMLTYIKSILTLNNTQDLIMKTENGTVILTVNKDNFMGNRCNLFDNINCHCKVIGKVVKTCSNGNCISLLRKTGQEQFYENFFEKCKILLECLRKNEIIVPECIDLIIKKNAVQIIPLNIYM